MFKQVGIYTHKTAVLNVTANATIHGDWATNATLFNFEGVDYFGQKFSKPSFDVRAQHVAVLWFGVQILDSAPVNSVRTSRA